MVLKTDLSLSKISLEMATERHPTLDLPAAVGRAVVPFFGETGDRPRHPIRIRKICHLPFTRPLRFPNGGGDRSTLCSEAKGGEA